MDQDYLEPEQVLPEAAVKADGQPPRGPASAPPAASTLEKIVSPGSTLGRYLAQSGMSAESAALANEMGDVKDRAQGKTLGQCLSEKIMHAAQNGSATLCTPNKEAIAGEIAEGAANHALRMAKGGIGHVLSEVFDTVASGVRVQNNHKDAIRILAQNDYPGMAYKEDVIGSIKVTTWADAVGAGLYPDDPKIKSYNKVESLNGAQDEADSFSRAEYSKIAQLKAQTENQALESAQNYVAENGYDKFRNRLYDAPAIMDTQYRQEQQAAAEFKQSIMPTPQDRLSYSTP